MARIGRPSKLTPELTTAICAAVEKGVPPSFAAQGAGISRGTFFDWMAKGARGVEPFAEFSDRVKESQGRAVTALMGRIEAAAIKSWQAAAWILERTHRSTFALVREDAVESRVARQLLATLKDALPPEAYALALAAIGSGARGGPGDLASAGEGAIGGPEAPAPGAPG